MKKKGDRSSLKLKDRNFKLNTLLEVSNAINNLESDLDLFAHFRTVLIEKLSLGKGLLISKMDTWSVNIRFGEQLDFYNEDLINKCSEYSRITVLNDVEESILSSFDVLIPIYHKSEPLSYLLLGDFEGEKIEVSPIIRHLPFIQTLTNLIVVAQENKRLFNENLKQVALKKELDLARTMQKMLMPVGIPERNDLDIYALYQPHQEVGGDYYDFFQVSENETVFCMADISGKGISAALLMSNFQAMMHAILEYDRDMEKLVRSLNNRLLKNTKGEKFITAFIALYNHETNVLQYVNAGHQPALFYNGKEVVELSHGTTILGAIDILPHLDVGEIIVAPNSTLITFTDGVCELENDSLEEFGIESLKKNLMSSNDMDITRLISEIMGSINTFKGNMEFNDDLALMGIRFTH